MDVRSQELQSHLDRLASRLVLKPIPVGFQTNDGLNVFVADDGQYHYCFYERGQQNFDDVGTLDDVLYWYAKGVVSSRSSREVGDRAQRFKYQFDVLSEINPDWGKRRIRELAAMFRTTQPEGIALLPDIGEPL
jgi:hypothetical protein